MFYKNLAFLLLIFIFSTSLAQAAEHGKKSHGSHAMSSKSGSQSEHHAQHSGHEKKHMLRNLIAAISKTGLNAEQITQVTQAINQFKLSKQQLKSQKTPPLEAFKDDGFDQQAFKNHLDSFHAMKVKAKIDLFEQIYSILNTEQQKIFKREFTAPMIEKMIKKNMLKGKDMKSGAMKIQDTSEHH